MCVCVCERYWQGLNFLGGFLLIIYDYHEAKAFWAMLCLLNNILSGLFGSAGPRVELSVLDAVLHEKLPVLCKSMEAQGVPVQTYTMQWMLCVFTTATPSITTVRRTPLAPTHPHFSVSVSVSMSLFLCLSVSRSLGLSICPSFSFSYMQC